VTNGPFAETKEALGGYFLIEAESLDEAINWAAKIPTGRHGVVEVRPVWTQERRSAPQGVYPRCPWSGGTAAAVGEEETLGVEVSDKQEAKCDDGAQDRQP
jgi:YCII-related domain